MDGHVVAHGERQTSRRPNSPSPATVNSHLRHAFTKLGIRSRVGLARIPMLSDTP
jgi:hypothetical protein